MAEQSVIGVYDTMAQAEEAVHKLEHEGFPVPQVSVVTQNMGSGTGTHGFITVGEDRTKHDAVTGTWVGGLFGLLIGSAFLWVPGFGPLLVAGRLAALLLAGIEGALAGAATGGLLGALANWGVAEEHIFDYEKKVKSGKYLVIAYGKPAEVAHAHDILQGTAASDLRLHTGVNA
jgi:hypothetical protein